MKRRCKMNVAGYRGKRRVGILPVDDRNCRFAIEEKERSKLNVGIALTQDIMMIYILNLLLSYREVTGKIISPPSVLRL